MPRVFRGHDRCLSAVVGYTTRSDYEKSHKQNGCDITQKHIDALKDWELEHPDWYSTDEGQETYNSMVAEITKGVTKTREKIKKLLSRQVYLPVTNNDIKTNVKI